MTDIKVTAVQFSYKPINSFKDYERNIEDLVSNAKDSDFIVFPEA